MKPEIPSGVRLRAYAIIRRAIEDGASLGVNRAFKHTETPSREHIAQCVEDAVLSELCDVLDFEET